MLKKCLVISVLFLLVCSSLFSESTTGSDELTEIWNSIEAYLWTMDSLLANQDEQMQMLQESLTGALNHSTDLEVSLSELTRLQQESEARTKLLEQNYLSLESLSQSLERDMALNRKISIGVGAVTVTLAVGALILALVK